MTIEYQFDKSDFLAFTAERRKLNRNSLSNYYYYAILPGLGFALALATQSLVIGSVFTGLYVLAGWLVQHLSERIVNRTYSSDYYLIEYAMRRKISLAEEGLRFSSDSVEGIYRWSYIREVNRSSDYVIFVEQSTQRIHIPIRAFAKEDQINQFIGMAQDLIKKAKK